MAAVPLAYPLDDEQQTGRSQAIAPRPGERKQKLEQLLREHRLQRESPPLRGEDRRLRSLPTGTASIDALLAGGFPRGQLSELYGPASSGRMALLVATLAQVTRSGALAAFVDPLDGFDPASAAGVGVDLSRLLWLRGRRGPHEDVSPRALAEATAAVATLAGSGLFDLVALDLVHAARALRGLPASTWLRLQRLVEETPTALVIVGENHVARSPVGAGLALEAAGAQWSGPPGPARLLRALLTRARAGRPGQRPADVALPASA